MSNDVKEASYDSDLKVQTFSFKGIRGTLPKHFHDYYVIGFIEAGNRNIICKDQESIVTSGSIVIFNPRDTHSSNQMDEEILDYRSIIIKPEVMKKVTLEITGREYLPFFNKNVLLQSKFYMLLRELHRMIYRGDCCCEKEELFLFLMGQLIYEYSDTTSDLFFVEQSSEFKTICDYIENNYAKTITLDELSNRIGLSKYHFSRSFTRQKGISPYSYLQNIRIGNAKKLLEKGIAPADAALQTGFNDQSHFTNFFKKFTSLTPKQYMRIYKMNHILLVYLILELWM